MLQKSPTIDVPAPSPPPPPPADDADLAAILRQGAAPSRLRRYLVVGAVVLLVVAGAWFAFGGRSATSAVTYATTPVVRGDLTVSVTATGTVQPTNQVEISSELSGT